MCFSVLRNSYFKKTIIKKKDLVLRNAVILYPWFLHWELAPKLLRSVHNYMRVRHWIIMSLPAVASWHLFVDCLNYARTCHQLGARCRFSNYTLSSANKQCAPLFLVYWCKLVLKTMCRRSPVPSVTVRSWTFLYKTEIFRTEGEKRLRELCCALNP